MGLIIGMDEAGYGPNLGPLVVTARRQAFHRSNSPGSPGISHILLLPSKRRPGNPLTAFNIAWKLPPTMAN